MKLKFGSTSGTVLCPKCGRISIQFFSFPYSLYLVRNHICPICQSEYCKCTTNDGLLWKDALIQYEKNDEIYNNSVKENFESKIVDIVFTHRLAFVQLLVSCTEEYNKEQSRLGTLKKVTSHEVELRNKPLGEPVSPTYNGTIKMSSTLKDMKQNELTKIKKLYADQDYSTADNYLQAICARFRNLIEQGIEMELLSKVVTRFDYSIKTMCLRYLHIITDDDINLFEEMMTRYSYFDHSQSVERPVSLPSIDDVEKDIDRVLAWSEDFKKRYNKCPK